MRSEAEVADVTGIVNDIRQSVFRHQNMGGGGGGYRLPCSPLLRCLIFRSFSLKVSAGVRDGKKYREYSLKINKVKKMRVTPGDEIVWDQAPKFGKRRSHSVMGILIPKTLVIWALTVTLTQITKVI